ncbi:microfibril-associated glycoprotein 4-like [Armigeres subalbatus]|uniref:microfibril-associated glycoprotein 4-like n=1 Tax=Armigeres subalbatus TaxID=124917 RepID=UPI002ED41032
MKSFFGYLACFVLLCGKSIISANNEPDAVSIEHRLDSLQASMNLMFMQASEQIEALTAEIHNLKQSVDILGWYSEQVKHSVASVQDNNELLLRNLTILTYHSADIIANQQYCANHEALKNLFFELTPKCGAFNSTPAPPEVVHSSCYEGPLRSGVYPLTINGSGHQYKAYCNMDDFGGGWTVFQKRQDGSVDFNRSWADYRNGFGDVSGEYWLGLETLHQLTTQRPHELLVILENFNGSTSYARYTGIVIDNEQQKYRILFNSSASGSAADSFYPYRGEIFVTFDALNGSYSSCARELASGFWHYSCNASGSRNNVNGVYGNSTSKNGIWWYNSFPGYLQYEPLKGVQMMIRQKNV